MAEKNHRKGTFGSVSGWGNRKVHAAGSFHKPDDKTHLAMKRFEQFIYDNKPKLQDPGSTRPMTFHGLRHTCAAEWYKQYIDAGDSEYQARKKVAKLLGHGRDDVTRIYLASLNV